MCEGRTMSNRTTHSDTVITQAGGTKVLSQQWTKASTNQGIKALDKEGTKACVHRPIKFLTAFTFMFAGSLYAQSSWAWPKFNRPKINLPQLPPIKVPTVKVPTTIGGLAQALNPLAPLEIVVTGNGNLDKGAVADGINTAVTVAVKTSPPAVLLGICGTSECKSVQKQIEKSVEVVTGPEVLNHAEERIKGGLRGLGDLCSLGEDGRARKIEEAKRDEEGQRLALEAARVLLNEKISQTRLALNSRWELITLLEISLADLEVVSGMLESNNKIAKQFLIAIGNTAESLMAFQLLLDSQFGVLSTYADRAGGNITQIGTQDNATEDAEMNLLELIAKLKTEMDIIKKDRDQDAILPTDALFKSYDFSTSLFVELKKRFKREQDQAKKEFDNLEASLKALENGEGGSK